MESSPVLRKGMRQELSSKSLESSTTRRFLGGSISKFNEEEVELGAVKQVAEKPVEIHVKQDSLFTFKEKGSNLVSIRSSLSHFIP